MSEKPGSESPEQERLVTVATFPQLMSAEMARTFLDNEGIPAQILHPHSGGLYGDAIGGIPLQVPERFVEKAVAILESSDAPDDADDADQPAPAA